MDQASTVVSPSLPPFILVAGALLTLLFILGAMSYVRTRTGAFVIFAAWLRYVMAAWHEITFRPLVAGMSANAVASLGIVALGLFSINVRHLALRFLTPIYVVIGIAIISAVLNNDIGGGLVNVITKFGYLIVIMLSVYGAMTKSRERDFMAAMLWAFAPVLLFQAVSLVLGIDKRTETDANAVSVIGGYNHEAAFSVMLATCLTVTIFTKLNRVVKTGIILVCLGGLMLANYRTTIVAVAPLLIAYFGFSSLQRFPLRERPFVLSTLIILCGLALGTISLFFAERFQDVTIVFNGDVNFFKPPYEYSVAESRLLSGRPRFWSVYIYTWLQGDLLNYVIGLGPESWAKTFPIYAHNTLVNYLYEYGLVGVAGILYLWFSMLAAALRIRHPRGGLVVAAHFSYLLLNMSTMPMWMIEGNILYGIICGYTLYLLSLQGRSRHSADGAGGQAAETSGAMPLAGRRTGPIVR